MEDRGWKLEVGEHSIDDGGRRALSLCVFVFPGEDHVRNASVTAPRIRLPFFDQAIRRVIYVVRHLRRGDRRGLQDTVISLHSQQDYPKVLSYH